MSWNDLKRLMEQRIAGAELEFSDLKRLYRAHTAGSTALIGKIPRAKRSNAFIEQFGFECYLRGMAEGIEAVRKQPQVLESLNAGDPQVCGLPVLREPAGRSSGT